MRPSESFIAQPVRDLQTMLRVISEDDPRQPTVVPDGIYGPDTMHAVSAFQRRNALPVTGTTDQNTWDQIVLAYEPALIRVNKAQPIEIIMNPGQVFKSGSVSPYIYLLQSMLTQLSKYYSAIESPGHSGILDERTSQALSSFQKISNLPVTGELDKITWKWLVHHFSLNAHHSEAHRDMNEL